MAENLPLGYINFHSEINYFNVDHRFSCWLIGEQKHLQEQAPGIYEDMIKVMILGKRKSVIRSALNDTLTRLERFSGNPFNITSDLYIQDDDLCGYY